MKIKLIASDMDDTLLNRDCKISERNAAAIKKAVAEGIIFLIATGRMMFLHVLMHLTLALMCRW